MRHTKGRWARSPLVLEDWQRDFWWEALEVDPATGLRVYSEVGLGLPRKNGKSVQASAAGLYFLVAEGEAEPEVYVAATARNQAGIVLGQSRRMAQQSPRLSRHVSVRTTLIECPRNGGVMRSLSADAALQHGLNPYANIIDELHAHRTADLYTALMTGTGAREQPFTLWISTAGVDAPGILVELHASMFDGPGELEDRGSLCIYRDRANGVLIWWYGAPRDADIEDPAVWLAANPASWLRDGTYLAQEYARLKARGALLDWRRYHLNQFVGTEEAWLPEGAWTSCRVGDPVPADPLHGLDPGLPVGVGIDKGQTSDLSAIVVAQRLGDRVVVRSRVFPPHPMTGRVNTESMRAYLRDLRGRFPLPQARDEKTGRALQGPAFAYDRWAFSESAETLEQEGLAMVDFPQNASTMGPASTQAFELITTGRLAHAGDPVLAEHVANTTALLTERGMKVTKPRRVTPRRQAERVVRDTLRRQDAIDELVRLGHAAVVTVHATRGRPREELQLARSAGPSSRFSPPPGLRPRPDTRNPGTNGTNSTDGLGERWDEGGRKLGRSPAEDPLADTATGEVTAASEATWASPCRDYRAHQDHHRNTAEGWVCLACQQGGAS